MPRRRTGLTKTAGAALAVTLATTLATTLAAGGCGNSGSPDDGTAGPGTSSGGPSATVVPLASATLNGAGATFPKAFYEEVIASFKQRQPAVTVNYNAVGSGAGRQQLKDGVVDFAGSDGLVAEADKPNYKGGEFLYVPTIAAPITVSYNLAGAQGLILDADTLARIFQRQVKQWDDAAIKALNPSLTLPSTAITVAHRSDGSGTTENFTKYLVAAAPSTWILKSGSTVEWPTDTQAGQGNQGVAQIVKSTAGAIGYVDLSDAKASGLRYASIRNKAGKAVQPTLEAASAALAGITVNDDLSYNPLNAEGEAAYPITAPTWILVYKNQSDRARAEALKGFLTFLLTDAQNLAASIDYARLPTSLQQRALTQLAKILSPAA